MHLGISILLAKDPDESDKKHLFTFLEPLSFSVWISLAGAYLIVSSTMWALAKFSPYEWLVPVHINTFSGLSRRPTSVVFVFQGRARIELQKLT